MHFEKYYAKPGNRVEYLSYHTRERLKRHTSVCTQEGLGWEPMTSPRVITKECTLSHPLILSLRLLHIKSNLRQRCWVVADCRNKWCGTCFCLISNKLLCTHGLQTDPLALQNHKSAGAMEPVPLKKNTTSTALTFMLADMLKTNADFDSVRQV